MSDGMIELSKADGALKHARGENVQIKPVAAKISSAPTGSPQWCKDLRTEVIELNEGLKRAYLRMSELVYWVNNTHIDDDPRKPMVYEQWGYESIHAWALAELNYSRRQVDFMRRIYRVLYVENEFQPEVLGRLEKLDYSKTRELVSVLTPDNADQWVERAEKKTYTELSTEISSYRKKIREVVKERVESGELDEKQVLQHTEVNLAAKDVDMPPPRESIAEIKRFALYQEQKEVVDEALRITSAIARSEKAGHLLTLICMDYIATNRAGSLPGTTDFRNYLTRLEELFDVRFVVFERKRAPDDVPPIIHGREYLLEVGKAVLLRDEDVESEVVEATIEPEDQDG